MKILLLGDLHFGAKQDDKWIQELQRQAIVQAIHVSHINGIVRWIQTGDWFDTRKSVTHKTMEFNREIAKLIEDAGISVDVLVGNHDMNLKQKIHPNACTELLGQFDNFTVYDKITTVKYGEVEIDLTPWVCDENKQEILDHIAQTSARYNIGHYELVGFYFYKGLKSHGDDPAFLRKYKKVWTGHFHTRSEARNVEFIGTPYTLTAGDENDIRGFTIFDTETEETTFIENTTMWHRRIDYPCSVNPNTFAGLSVRIFAHEIDKGFAKFETAIEAVAHEVKTVVKVELSSEGTDDVDDDAPPKTLVELIEDHIKNIPDISGVDCDSATKFSKELYMEAIR